MDRHRASDPRSIREARFGRTFRPLAALLGALLALACVPLRDADPPTRIESRPAGTRDACLRIVRIEVRKDQHRLDAYCEGDVRVSLAVAIGRDPNGPKRRSGDMRTPEGVYRISGPPRPSRFHRFIPIDYPSTTDAEAARADGRISEADYARILDAHARGLSPPRNTPLGTDLGFHGEGERWRGDSVDLDWTAGCVAMTDDDIDFLAAHAPAGTPVVILP